MIYPNLFVTILKFIYKIKSLYNFFSLIVRFIDCVLPIKRNQILFHGYGGRYVGNAKILFQYYLKHGNDNLIPKWLLDSKDSQYFWNSKNIHQLPMIHSSFLDHFRFLIVLIKARVIITTSVGDIYLYRNLLSRRRHIQVLLLNGSTLKSTGVASLHLEGDSKKIWEKIPQSFNIISASSRLEKYILSSGFNYNVNKIKVIGPQRRDIDCSYNKKQKETLFQIINQKLDNNSKLILYAPTHRDHIKLEQNPFGYLEMLNGFDPKLLNEKLKDFNFHLLLRDHLEGSMNGNKETLGLMSNIHDLSNIVLPDVDEVIYGLDMVITDYSGIYLELLDCHHSIAFIPYDLEEYEKERGLALPYDFYKVGPTLLSQDDMLNYFDNIREIDTKFLQRRKILLSTIFEVGRGNSCRLTKMIIDKEIKK